MSRKFVEVSKIVFQISKKFISNFRNFIEIGHMLQAPQLIAQRTTHGAVAMAECARSNACDGIEVAIASVVANPTPSTTNKSEWIAVVGPHHCSGRGGA